MRTEHKCPRCGKAIAREGRKDGLLRPVGGASLSTHGDVGQAPRVRCPCGRVIILLRGTTT